MQSSCPSPLFCAKLQNSRATPSRRKVAELERENKCQQYCQLCLPGIFIKQYNLPLISILSSIYSNSPLTGKLSLVSELMNEVFLLVRIGENFHRLVYLDFEFYRNMHFHATHFHLCVKKIYHCIAFNLQVVFKIYC